MMALKRRRKHLEIHIYDIALITELFILEFILIESCKNCLDAHVPHVQLLSMVTSDTVEYNMETRKQILLFYC